MFIFSIFFSLFSLLICYWLVSKKDRSYVNVLTPYFIIFLPLNYLFELLHILLNGSSGSDFAYFFTYLSYSLFFSSLTLAYLFAPTPRFLYPSKVYSTHNKLLPYILMTIGILLYLPVLLEFIHIIKNPREIYSATRIGYGINFYLSSTFAYLAFILFIFGGRFILPIIACSIFLLLHGSKGQVLVPFLLLILFRVYVENKKVKLLKASGYIASISLLIFASFFLITIKDTDLRTSLEFMTDYSDATRNTLMVIDRFDDFKFGKLTFEENTYPRIPRLFFPDKPKDFGVFFLTKEFIPDRFELETGSPYFGIVSVPYADFGLFSLFYLVFVGLFIGWGLKIFRSRLAFSKAPSDFVMFAFFSSVGIIPTGVGFLLPDHLLLAWFLGFLTKLKISLIPSSSCTSFNNRISI